MRFVGVIAAIVLILAFALPAHAETQSVKISGDLTFRGIHRDEYDLDKNRPAEDEDFLMSTIEVQIDAVLTDNVSTVVRIVNQRNWGDSDYKALNLNELSQNGDYLEVGHGLLDLGIDLGYVQIKELIFEPLTVRIGRQDLWFGRGLVIGANQTDPGRVTGRIAGRALGTYRGIDSPELTAYNSFDAIRATIDFEKYGPLVMDLVYFKNDENEIDAKDDINVYGTNLAYKWDTYEGETEAYYWLKLDGSVADGNTNLGEYATTNIIGVRGSFKPQEDCVFGGEAAYQFGRYIGSTSQPEERKRSAFMVNAFVDYLGWTKYMYSPKIGAEWLFLSGDHNRGVGGDLYGAWDPMYRGHYPLLIRPFQGYYYMTGRFPAGQDIGLTNQHEFIVSGSIEPLDDITIEAKAAKYYFDEEPVLGGTGHDIGTELDIMTTYDYTEDVTLSLLTAWFFPGSVYDNQDPAQGEAVTGVDLQPEIANEVIASCKVSF